MMGPSQTASSRSFASHLYAILWQLWNIPHFYRDQKWNEISNLLQGVAVPFLNVLEECSCPLQSCCLVSVNCAEGNEEIELITTNPDPAPAGKHTRLSTMGQREGKKTENKNTTHMCYEPWTLGTAFCLLQALYISFVTHKSLNLYRMGEMFWNLFVCLQSKNTKTRKPQWNIDIFPSKKHQTLTSCTAFSWS